jgi:hypothetical protein
MRTLDGRMTKEDDWIINVSRTSRWKYMVDEERNECRRRGSVVLRPTKIGEAYAADLACEWSFEDSPPVP